VPSPVVDLLARVGAALEPLGIRWYLFGAQAAILHGASRLTADVDITVDAGNRPTADLVRALVQQGLELRVAAADGFVERTRVLPLVHTDSRMPVDVVLAGPGLEELFFQRVEVRVVEGVRIPVIAPDDLVAMKILAGRPKDIEDAVAVLRAQGALDIVRARETLGLLERALDRRDLLPLLEQAIEQARGRD
jgi:hypothetical protein